ncbi:SURF1 family protein [Plantactinospora sp. GCM10030261]|uniref:SURF1 family cytochrome oxidase biogenesis protein n=1 Tax=Plantactinospora sp. GCM10030261 TaxID=3273420 RepID=UPI00360B9128
MYRFLLTPRWLGILALTLVAATVMVLLGNWQLHRYQQRAATNERIDATARVDPAPLTRVLSAPAGAAGSVGPAPTGEQEWTRVSVTGEYDPANLVLVRGRTVQGRVGYEVLTPLRLADGSAVLVDRGWVPPAPGAATAVPRVPAAPTGQVTVVGRVRVSESRPETVARRGGNLETRRISVPTIAAALPYPVYGGYLLLDEQTPPADAAFVAIPVKHENDWQNAGYVVQWWLFAGMALFGYGWLARREARGARPGAASTARGGRQPAVDRVPTAAEPHPATADRDPATDSSSAVR